MRQRVFMPILAFFYLIPATVGFGADKVLLQYKAKPGQVVRSRTEATLTIEAAGMKLAMEMKLIEKRTYISVSETGEITLERLSESYEMTMNGQKMPRSEEGEDKATITIRPDGTLVSLKLEQDEENAKQQAARMLPAMAVVFSGKEVGVGDKWSHEYKADAETGAVAGKAEFELLGFETVNGIETAKIRMEYAESEGSPAMSSKGTYWVDKASGDSVRSEVELENMSFETAGQPVSASGKFSVERTEGSPISQESKSGDATPGAKPEPKKEKTIDDVIKDFEKLPGLWTLYRKMEAGKDTIYAEIREDQLDKLMLLEVTASTGDSSHVVAGDPINDLIFKLSRAPADKILMVVPNIQFRAKEGTPLARAVRRSFADGFLESFKIEAKQAERNSLLINISDLFRGDIAQISSLFAGGNPLGLAVPGMGGASYSLDKEKTFITQLKVFPENLVVETQYHFQRSGSANLLEMLQASTLADLRSAPVKINYTLFALPESGYTPRLADPRVGYFLTEYQDFDKDNRDDMMVRYIYRWNLKKADPAAALSKPEKPIEFWLDNAIPVEYRDAVRAGLTYWNRAFEKVGIKDAIIVHQMPDDADWDHADMRHNLIRWVTSPGNAYAVALFRVNPLTGQILNANITVDAGIVRVFKLERQKIVDPASYFEPKAVSLCNHPSQCNLAAEAMEQAWFGHTALSMLTPGNISEQEYVNSFIKWVVSHEMGHLMGLRHNFIASTELGMEELGNATLVNSCNTSASVMDYVPFNISALKKTGVDYFSQALGKYDSWAIEYGYKDFNAATPEAEKSDLAAIASRCNEPGHLYQSDEIADQFDPLVTRFDLSADPLAYWAKMLQVSRHLLLNLGQRSPGTGESYWEFTRDFMQLLGFYSRAAAVSARYIGGLHVNRNHKGDKSEEPTLAPIDGAKQRKALELLNTYIFAENALTFPESYYVRMTGDPFPSLASLITGGLAQDFPLRDRLSGIQRSALRAIFSASTLGRITNNEFKVGSGKTLSLPWMFRSVSANIWAELEGKKAIRDLRRDLQRAHLDLLSSMIVEQQAAVPADAQMLAWEQLRSLKKRIQKAQKQAKLDEYSRIHLEESLMRIDRVLEARLTIGGSSTSAPNLLDLLMRGGGKKR